MINFIKEYIRDKVLRAKKSNISPKFINLEEMRSIGFMYNITSPSSFEELNKISAFLDKVGILYYGLAIETKGGLLPQMESAKDIPEFVKELEDKEILLVERLHLNWIGIPNAEKIDKFLERDFDLFITFNNNNDFTLEYILRDIKAKFIIGMQNNPNSPYTLVMEGENKTTLNYIEYLQQIFHYMNIIKASKA
ncbi:MAG: hypothetical protein RR919_02115 [Bacteroidales bacterium]